MTSRPSADAPMIEVEGVSRSFGSVTALNDVSMTAPRGTVLGLLGHNGAGKTTLVNILTTLLPPTSGTARVAGFDVTEKPAQVRARIGLTGQFASVDESLSGRENLVLIARLLGASLAQARSRADELLEVFELSAAARRPAHTYSGGMRRRLDLAASIVGHPEVIFLDEPTTGLDPQARSSVQDIVQGLADDGTTILLTTQYLDEADRLADSITVLSAGSVIASGTSAELKAEVGTLSVRTTFASDADAGRASDTLRARGLAPADGDEHATLVVPIEASRHLADVVAAVQDAGVEATGYGLTEPTLDDVYLALTAHSADRSAA